MTSPLFLIPALLAALVVALQPVSAGEEAATEKKTREVYRSQLEYGKATYASIFGLIPKEGPFELKEDRVIVRKQVPGQPVFELHPKESNVRRVLRIPDELPLLENDPKPLTGRKLIVREVEGRWKPEIQDVESPTPAELREADRLAARFAPGASPFVGLPSDLSTEKPLDLPRLLTFLGYATPEDILGEAKVGGSPASAEKQGTRSPEAGKLPIQIETMFSMGQDKDKISVELKAQGTLAKSTEQDDFSSLILMGNLMIAGKRDLPDGRRVPFNVVADFTYKAEREVVAAE
ncbi:MAG: hypothetical protein ACKV19_29720 [Verrucomicrobiales bacterium]